jgi:hypothetical protein
MRPVSSRREWVWCVRGCVLGSALACGGLDATTLVTDVQQANPGAQQSEASSVGAQPSPSANLPSAGAGQLIESDHVKTRREADGSFASAVNATSMQDWVYFSLRDLSESTPAVPEQSNGWDLGFQRSNVKLNGGTSGAAGVSVRAVTGPFDSVLEAPLDGYIADAEDMDRDGSPDYAFSAGDGWYAYDSATHRLTARETVFVVQTQGAHFKLQFSGYYDSAGTPGVPQFRWARLGQP